MNLNRKFLILVYSSVCAVFLSARGYATPAEDALRDQWWSKFNGVASALPFSFTLDDRPSTEVLKTWTLERSERKLDENRTELVLTCTDPAGALSVRCVAVKYADFPVIEWTVYFKNTGKENTPILEDIQGLDVRFERSTEGEFVLHGIKGDFCSAESYEPYQFKLDTNATKKFSPRASGKSCDGPDGWPYFNLQMPGSGIILAVGWPGQWSSSFTREAAKGLRIKAGQQLTHLFLKPGEEIRTPLTVLLFWQGTDVVRSQNIWRRWYMAHNIPREDGRPQSPVAHMNGGGSKINIAHLEKLLQAGIKIDVCWRDAGGDNTWFPTEDGPYQKGHKFYKAGKAWWNTGHWEIDPKMYPEGFKPFTDYLHANGIEFMLWFEPERVGNPNSWLAENHPEWLLPGNSLTFGIKPGLDPILDEGNPAALKWLIDHIDSMIKSEGIDWYREDMNGGGPLQAWRKNDPSDRQGITENHYVQGHLAFWDELKRRNPGLSIDSCASGGRRNDLETMRRAVPFLRSDFGGNPELEGAVEGNQGHTYGLSFWLPYQGSGTRLYDTYSFRSFYLPSFIMVGGKIEVMKKAYSECRKIAPYMLFGDYYPLTPYSRQLDQWIAWQFNRPEEGDGVVQAFRRGNCEEATKTFRLSGLDPTAQYEVTNFDIAGSTKMSGKELMEKGLVVENKDKPGAAVIVYSRLK